MDKRDIFDDEKDYIRFLVSMREFNCVEAIGSLHVLKGTRSLKAFRDRVPSPPLVEIICYCLNSNHYHFILKQKVEGGISEFIKRVASGYTSYFNARNNRSGALFQGKFKAVKIRSSDQLIQLSCYINGNPEIHKLAKAENYIWSSYQDFLGKRNGTMCKKDIVLDEFNNVKEYQELTNYLIKELGERKDDEKNYFLE